MTFFTKMDNTTLAAISTPDLAHSTEPGTTWSLVTTQTSFVDDDDPSSTGLIVGLSVAAVIVITIALVVFVVRKKFCIQLPSKGRKNGGVRSSEQVMFAISGSNRNSRISGIESQRTSQLGHPINFDEYVDIDPSATIEQPNSLQPDGLAVDLQPSSLNPAYDGLLNAMGEYAEPEFLQEDDTAVKAINKTILNVEKEDADLNSKTRKFSLQELKSQESEVKHANKKRNISLPDLPDSSSVTMRSDGTHSKPTTKQTNALNAATNSEKSVNLKRQNAIDEDRQNGKVSSLRSVLLEVDAYENIEIVNKQSRIRAGVVSMKEQSVNAESKQVPVRRAFSEQTRAPVPKPRTNALLKKRKTFDPYDYPPGVPIPQALLEEDEEVRDSEYIAHDPFAEETNALKRKTFDPYDYPPGFPIPKALLENGEHNEHDQTVNVAGESDNNDTDNTFIESSGVYIAYDPDNNEETNELDENVGGDYINCSDVVFEEDKYNGTQNSLDSKTTEYEQDAAISPFEAHAPPKPCSGPYYVNELVNVFDTETGRQAGITNETDTKSDAYSPTNTSPEIINPNLNDGYALHDDKNILKNYDNILVNGNVSLANNRTDKTAAVTPGTSTTELRSESAHKLSELEGSLPLDAEKDMPQYLSDNDGVYQNLVPPKPPRLHTSLEKLDNNPEHINTNLAGTNNSPPKDNLQDENQESYDYEDVLVMHKRKESEKDVGHGYVNVKRFS